MSNPLLDPVIEPAPVPKPPGNWVSPPMLAEELDIPLNTLYAWRRQGAGPIAHRIGRHLRYRRSDVEAWLASQRDAR